MKSNRLYKYDSDFDFDDLAEEIIDEVNEQSVEAAEDTDKLIKMSLAITGPEKRDDSYHLRRVLEFLLRDIGGNPTVAIKTSYAYDTEASWNMGSAGIRSQATVEVNFTRPDFQDVRQIAFTINMMRRIFSDTFDFSWSYMSFTFNNREFRISGNELPFSTGINGRIIKSYKDAKGAYKFCIAMAGIENASELFEQTMCINIERAMLENYINQKNDLKRSSFVIPEEQRAQVRGYRPSVYISNSITADKANRDINTYVKRGLYTVRDLLPTPYVKTKNLFFQSIETSADAYVYVVYNVLVDDELNMSCVFNEIPVRNCVNLHTDIAKHVLRALKSKELDKQLEEIHLEKQNDTSKFALKAT